MQVSGIKSYEKALQSFQQTQKSFEKSSSSSSMEMETSARPISNSFSNTIAESLTSVNDLQSEKNAMITSFASGETQNVHELMISMQKAGVAVNMTAAVRNKVLEAYKELSRIQF